MDSTKSDLSAVISGDRILTHGELEIAARRMAGALRDAGIGEGDVVALIAYNSFSYFVLAEAVRYLGANLTPVNWHLAPPEIGYILKDCDAKAVVMHASLATEKMIDAIGDRKLYIEPVADEISAAYGLSSASTNTQTKFPPLSEIMQQTEPVQGDPAPAAPALFYTSGTSGTPKAVKRKTVAPGVQQAVAARSICAFGLSGNEPMVSVMTGPLYHSAPNAYGMFVVRLGGTLILQPRFDALALLALIEKYKVSHLHMVPTMFQRLLALSEAERSAYDLSSLQNVVHGAAPCPTEVKYSMISWWGPIIHEYYAMTELGIIACCDSHEWLAHPGSVGRAPTGVTIEIQDQGGAAVETGGEGEICVEHETSNAFEYHGDPKKTQMAQRNRRFATGDVGYLDEDGFLYISDRKSDMILSGGVNIYPAEIEKALVSIGGVEDAVVFGVHSADFGEQVVALVVSSVIKDEAKIRIQLRESIAGFKVPRIIQFVDTLPREDSGKIKKRLIRESFLASTANAND